MNWARIGSRLRSWRHWLTAKGVLAIFALLRLMSADRALNLADWLGKTVGPWTGRHRVTLDNLRKAYPEKSEEEIQAIAHDMWGHMARLAAEYVFLDRLFDFRPFSDAHHRVEVDGVDVFLRVLETRKPRIFFTAHTGCFEMFPVAAATFGLDLVALFRAPNNPYMAEELASARNVSNARMIASRSGAAISLARVLEEDGAVGALVDQKFISGIPTTFFGVECQTSPLVPRLARQFDADIHPARCIRLPGNRYRLEILDPIEPARDANGQIDPAALAQQMNDIIEGWVREYPGQWMWFHKRWEIRERRKRGKAA